MSGDEKRLSGILKSAAFRLLSGIILIFSGMLLYTSAYRENIFSSFISKVTSPIGVAVSEVWSSALEVLPNWGDVNELEQEVKELKEQVRQLRAVTEDYYEMKRQNAQYEKYFGFKQQNTGLEFISASVIGRDPGELFYGVTLNRGSESGICVGDSVATENGIVGCVYQVNKGSSRVRSILSPDIKIGAIDKTSGDNGIISGSIKYSDMNLTRMTLISSQNLIREGDIITSAGMTGMYPRDMQLGKVKYLEYDAFESSYYAVVEPFENIHELRDVLVVTGFPGKGEINIGA